MKRTKNNSFWVWAVAFVMLALYVATTLLSDEITTSTATQAPIPPSPTVLSATSTQGPTSFSDDWYRVFFTSPADPFDNIVSGGIEENLISLIDGSTTSVDAAFFEFDLENLAQAIFRAHNRGVTVRLVYDNEHTDEDPQIHEMIEAGIEAVPDDRSAYMHNKFVVVDGLCVWTGSFNFTINASYRNNENAIIICDQKLASNYSTEFSELFSGEFGPTSTANTPYPVFQLGDVVIENYFAPEDNVMDQVVSEILSAQDTIHFMTFSFTDDTLAQSMVDLINDGVLVTGIFESRSAGATGSACPDLYQNGAQISLDGNPRTFHHKVIIIDSNTVIFGSFNFSANANENNDENLLIIHNASLASEFEKEFQRRLAESNSQIDSNCSTK
jgi:phosphatidylserine/phosphatidylglycerophosphate/cardiolipin synthase-like enzyme